MQTIQNEPIKQVSFFESILPGLDTEEGKKFNKNRLNIPKNGINDKGDAISKLAILLLSVAVETGEAIANNNYKYFDALVGNFGCQITALDVYGKVLNRELCMEAVRVSESARNKLDMLNDMVQKSLEKSKPIFSMNLTPQEKNLNQTMLTILQNPKIDIDFKMSMELQNLCRFRLLQLINDNRIGKEGREMPFTNINSLFNKLNEVRTSLDKKQITQKNDPKLNSTLEQLISIIQIEEAKKAVCFIQQVALRMNKTDKRIEIIQCLLEKKFEKTNFKIISLPLNYNTEACLRSIEGIVLIKNKLSDWQRQPIEGAIPQKLFLRMPGELILSDKDISELPENEPLIVLEGFVREGISLAETIMEVGLVPLVLSNCAELPQYANSQKDDFGLIDEDTKNEIKSYRVLNLSASKFFLDHFYCASVKEER